MASCLTPGGRRCPVRGASDSIEPAGGYDLSKLQASSVTSTRTRRRTSTSTGAGGSVGEIPTERHRQRGTPESASGRVRLQRHRHLPGAAGCRCNLRTRRPCLAVLLSRSGADRTVQPDRVQRRRVSERIDFILASPGLATRCTQATVVNEGATGPLSDHFPVIADFKTQAAR